MRGQGRKLKPSIAMGAPTPQTPCLVNRRGLWVVFPGGDESLRGELCKVTLIVELRRSESQRKRAGGFEDGLMEGLR